MFLHFHFWIQKLQWFPPGTAFRYLECNIFKEYKTRFCFPEYTLISIKQQTKIISKNLVFYNVWFHGKWGKPDLAFPFLFKSPFNFTKLSAELSIYYHLLTFDIKITGLFCWPGTPNCWRLLVRQVENFVCLLW